MNKRKFLTALAAIPAVAALAACGATGTTLDWPTITGDVNLVLTELQAIEVQAVAINPKLLSADQQAQITKAFSTIIVGGIPKGLPNGLSKGIQIKKPGFYYSEKSGFPVLCMGKSDDVLIENPKSKNRKTKK